MGCHVFCATSLDGFLARPDGALDWLPESPEDHGYAAFMAGIDALVMGRKTYETVLGFGGAWPFTKPVVVLSRHPLKPAPAGAKVERMEGEPAAIVQALAARGLQELYVDGGVTLTRFLAAGLVDRMTLTRIPVLLGAGLPLFGPLDGDRRFRHVATRSWPSGLVQSVYERA